MRNNLLLKCPKCKKWPKIKIGYAYKSIKYGNNITIQCKSIFGKNHLKIEVEDTNKIRAMCKAIEKWNYEVKLSSIL